MRKSVLFAVLAVSTLAYFSGCSAPKTSMSIPPQPKVVNLDLTATPRANAYVNLDYGIRINLRDNRPAENRNILLKHDNYVTSKPSVSVNPDVVSFVSESIRRYMRTMGFKLDSDIASDYMMSLTIKTFNVSWLDGIGWSAVVGMDVAVYDHENRQVYPTVGISGRASRQGSGSNYALASQAVNQAYANALEDIDWDRIAYFLHRSSSPSAEKDKAVTGDGNTALEHTILSWEITSRPAGADVFWRIISSTPDVKNTNKNYKATTPYESTESFDIKGLTYNNSVDVQIEISCEKPGYLPQRKVFNLRSAIDQKSINAHFTLVRDE